MNNTNQKAEDCYNKKELEDLLWKRGFYIKKRATAEDPLNFIWTHKHTNKKLCEEDLLYESKAKVDFFIEKAASW